MTPAIDHPREVAPGNVMQLKEPYRAWNGHARTTWTHGIVAQVLHSGMGGGINNPHWRVSLHLYNPDTGKVYLHEPTGIPVYVDFGADEMLLVKVARQVGYQPLDHDLYPVCGACAGEGWKVVGQDFNRDEVEARCPTCRGFGKVFTPLPVEPRVAPPPEAVS